MNGILYLDFYADRPTLFIKKEEAYRTYIGSILSILTTLFLIGILIFIIFCFINDTGLSVLYDKTSKGLDNLDINLSKNIFFYRLNDKGGKNIDERIINSYPYLTISTSEGTKYILLKKIQCNVDRLIKENDEYKNLINFDVSTYNCLTYDNGDDVILQRRGSPFKNSYINLFITKCHNDTENNINNCVSEEEIEKYIEKNSINVNFFLESAAIDHHNYSHPLTKKYYQNSMSIGKEFIFSYTFFWRKIEYYTRNSLILFNYLFQSSGFLLDSTIKDKDFYTKNHVFYEEKTIGRLQFLITVEYADSYVRKYITLVDSFTLFMTGFNVITKICYILNYFFSKSYKYCSIFEPIIVNSIPTRFRETTEFKIFPSPSINSNSCSKVQLVENKKKISGLSMLKINNTTFPVNKMENKNNSEMQRNDEIKSIINDIHSQKINCNVNMADNFLFLFNKMFNFHNRKQLYLERVERIIQEELSLDHLFQDFKNIKLIIFQELKKKELEKQNFMISENTPFRFSINNVSSIKNIQ